jgi:hypothetical protein
MAVVDQVTGKLCSNGFRFPYAIGLGCNQPIRGSLSRDVARQVLKRSHGQSDSQGCAVV